MMKFPKKLINLYTIIGFILIINLGTLAVLRFGNPQWHRWIYVFQCYYWPGHKLEMTIGDNLYSSPVFYNFISPPENYTGKWKLWYKNGGLKESVNFNNGKLNGPSVYYFSSGRIRAKINWQNGDLNSGDGFKEKTGQKFNISGYTLIGNHLFNISQ